MRSPAVKRATQVTILGQPYTVRSDSTPEQIARVADFVNEQLTAVAQAAPTADTRHITVLTLLNIAGSYLELQAEQGGADQRRLQDLIERIDRAEAR
ncbi:hypothetical protein B5V00_15160 [Geothermobacter hydrogeniphilus]|uniref:Cell division protein ZapA n=1 Tax=Geothermobacter hydrogeniphilus TaxID=1969733 RepID=A0A1X0XSG5_9BACT|nr:hypothetical protein B5V00_15160 [Geothermobacter hydrogeniphilus]